MLDFVDLSYNSEGFLVIIIPLPELLPGGLQHQYLLSLVFFNKFNKTFFSKESQYFL